MQGLWNLLGKSGQGPGKDFQYDIGDKVLSNFDSKSVWNLYQGKKRTSGDLVSVFVCDVKVSSQEDLHLAKTACKRLKTLRHPNIIKFIDAFENDSIVYVVTEPVTPLLNFLDEEDGRNSNLITWGLHQVITGLSFLINNGNLQHENVNIFSIFVGLDGEWKLGGVEYVHTSDTDSVSRQSYLSSYDPPDSKGKRKEKWSSDAWGLGCLIWEIYNGALEKASDLKNIKKIPKSLVVHYCDLVSANPKSRTNPKDFLEKATEPGNFLCNDFIKANLFLQEIQIKDINEQKTFFASLDKSLDKFPKQFCVHKVLPQLLNAFEYGTAGSAVLSPLFKVGLLLDEVAYQTKIVPCIIKLFSSNDRATRIQLLQQMEKFVKHLQPNVVDTQIFPCVASGFGDTLPAMREQTVKAMLLLAPKLSQKTIDNNLLRHFAKLQMDEQPGIRTNTTICIGRIAAYFSDATKQKILVPAFTRSLRDPFPPARNAGVAAISACQEYFSMPEIAMKILPVLCSATVDSEKAVRDNVFRVIKIFMKKIEDYSNNPNSALNNKEVAEQEAKAQGGTWTGWAVNSFTSRFYQNQTKNPSDLVGTSEEKCNEKDDAKQADKNVPVSKEDRFSNENLSSPLKGMKKKSDMWEDKEPPDVNKSANTALKDTNDSDSDYEGDDWNNDWSDAPSTNKFDAWSGTVAATAKEGKDGWKESGADGWNLNEPSDDTWGDMNDTWGVEATVEVTKKANNAKEKSVADLLGMSSDIGDFLSNENNDSWQDSFVVTPNKPSNNTSQHISSSQTSSFDWKENDNTGWGDNDYWNNDETDIDAEKENRKLELQRKREERKLQRELQNKEKRTTKSSGALKLGAVKKK